MAYEQKDNSGSLFKNDRKEQDTHADYRGSIMVAGVEYWIDAWLNEKRDGSGKYLGLKVKPKDAARIPAQQTRSAPPPAGRGFNDLDDDVPF